AGLEKARGNSGCIANSIQCRWKNSSFSTTRAVVHEFAWPWIGKRQIYRLGNRMHPTTNPRLINELTPFEAVCHYPVSRGCCEGAAAVKANLRSRINIKFRM